MSRCCWYIHGWVKLQINKAKLPRTFNALSRDHAWHQQRYSRDFLKLETSLSVLRIWGIIPFLQYWKYPYPDVFPLIFSIFVKLLFSRLGVPDQRRYWYPRSFMRASSASCLSAPLSQACYHVLATPYSIFGSWWLPTLHSSDCGISVKYTRDRSRGLPRRRWTGIFYNLFLPV